MMKDQMGALPGGASVFGVTGEEAVKLPVPDARLCADPVAYKTQFNDGMPAE